MQHHYFTLPSTQKKAQTLHYTAWGSPSAPAVVCVHGLTRNARDFDYLANALSADYYVICIDVIGRGESSWVKDGAEYNVLNYAQQILLLLNHLNLNQPHWVGTSMGGLIALTLQLIAPQRFKKLVLNDVGPVIDAVFLRRLVQYIGAQPRFATRELAVAYAKDTMASFGASNEAQWKGLTDFYYRQQADGSVLLHYDLLIAQVVKAQVAGMTAQAVATGEATLWNSLKSLQNPVLVMKGADSDLLSASTVNQMLDCNSLVKAVTIPNCGHAPHLMDAHQVQVVHSFLSEQI